MLLPRARQFGLAGLVLTTLCYSLSDAQTNDQPGRTRVKSTPPANNSVRARRKGEEDPPAARPKSVMREERTEPPELHVEDLPPALEKLLKEWEAASAKITTLSGEHKRIVRNEVFGIEKWAKGEFFYESPDKGRIDLAGIEPKGATSRKKKADGKPYVVQADIPSIWICNGKSVFNIIEAKKEYERFDLPEDMQGKNIIHGPLPFLFGMKAEEAKKRFDLSFVDEEASDKNNDKVVWIRARPRQLMDRDNFQEARIILDRKKFLPHFVQLIDPSGNVETIYEFPADKLVVNKRHLVPKMFQNRPFEPKLAGLTRIMPPDISENSDSGVLPASGEKPGRSPGQTKKADKNPSPGNGKGKQRS